MHIINSDSDMLILQVLCPVTQLCQGFGLQLEGFKGLATPLLEHRNQMSGMTSFGPTVTAELMDGNKRKKGRN